MYIWTGSNDYVNNYLQPFLADSQQYSHDEFVELLTSTLDKQLSVKTTLLPCPPTSQANIVCFGQIIKKNFAKRIILWGKWL